MTASIVRQNNPYIIGVPVLKPECFFGREDIFQFIKDNLTKNAKVILLYGQRRIGKSSVLSQIHNFVQLEQFFFVSFSLEGKSNKPLSEVLYEISLEIRDDLEDKLGLQVDKIIIPSKKDLKKNQRLFAEDFFTQVFEILNGKNLVLVLDEFDVLGDSSEDTAVTHFFPYLKSLIDEQEKLFIIPVVGRRLDDVPSLLNLFHQAPNQRIGLLQERNAKRLITQPAEGILEYQPDAIQAILKLSAGHPYFTQVMCYAIFFKAREEENSSVTREDVERVIDQAIENGAAGLAWFHDGLSLFERVVFSAVAEAQQEIARIIGLTERELFTLLQDGGVIQTYAIKQALERLVEWGFLAVTEKPELPKVKSPIYTVKIELVRRWLVRQHPLRREIRELKKELATNIPILLEALNSPIGQVVNSAVSFLSIATGLINNFVEENQKEPSIAEIIGIVTQAAYLESIKTILPSESIFTQDNRHASDVVKKQIRKLEDIEIDDKEVRLALVSFPESKLAQAFNEVLDARLQETGIPQSQIQIAVKRVAANTSRYIHSAIAEIGDEIQRLFDWYSTGGREEIYQYLSIDTYLEERIKPLPEQKVFEEEFSFQDIYVPLKAIHLDINGEEISHAHDFVLDEWAQKTIIDPEKQDQVIFIQAGHGRGKSVFCRMFADWVRQNLHPLLTPILIRLRDIEHFEQSFFKTLSDALSNCDFVSNDSGWLTDYNTQYLFLLDGFDELRIEGRASGGLERFIRQVGLFQEKFRGQEKGHRVILTGLPLALQGMNYLPDNLERVELLPMNDELRAKWLENWQQVVIPDNPVAAKEETEKFKGFLEACPEEITNKLAREPLLLYLLAKLHEAKEIQQEDFDQGSDSTQAKILIYQKSLEWVLKKQRGEFLQHQITGLNIDSLERILTEAGLCVVQSGGEYAKVKMIETRLARNDSDAADIITKLRNKRGEKALTTALGAFYLRPAAGKKRGGVEFYHKSFGEFFCAKRLQESLSTWTTRVNIGRQQQWFISKEELARQIYDLLGYGGLTPEIVEYLRGLLIKSNEFRPVELFQRLSDFYWRWCDGEFIDAEGTILPHLKMRELKEQLPERETYLGQRQVDVYAGLNIMILLLELHRYGQSQTGDIKQQLTFYPCGQPKANGNPEEPTLLLRLIDYSNCIGIKGFKDTVGNFLHGADLHGADLVGAKLGGADLN